MKKDGSCLSMAGQSNGRGGMQRTVFKAHPRAKIAEWDGSNLNNKGC